MAGRRGELAEEVGAALGGSGVACDITDEDPIAAVVATVLERHDGLDVLVNDLAERRATDRLDRGDRDLVRQGRADGVREEHRSVA